MFLMREVPLYLQMMSISENFLSSPGHLPRAPHRRIFLTAGFSRTFWAPRKPPTPTAQNTEHEIQNIEHNPQNPRLTPPNPTPGHHPRAPHRGVPRTHILGSGQATDPRRSVKRRPCGGRCGGLDHGTLNPAPCTLNPAPQTLNPAPQTLNPGPCTPNPAPQTLRPKPQNHDIFNRKP